MAASLHTGGATTQGNQWVTTPAETTEPLHVFPLKHQQHQKINENADTFLITEGRALSLSYSNYAQ